MKRILVVADYPTITDSKRTSHFTQGTWHDFKLWMDAAGFNREDVEYTYLHPTYPPHNDQSKWFCTKTQYISKGFRKWGDKYIAPALALSMENLKAKIKLSSYELVILAGDLPLMALFNESSIVNWRGSQLFWEGIRCLPIISPVQANRNFEWTFFVRHDLGRAHSFWSKKQVEPKVNFLINPTFIQAFSYLRAIPDGAKVGVDIETRLKFITYISVATSYTDAICIPFIKADGKTSYWSEQEEIEIVRQLLRVINNSENVGHNYVYDLQYLSRYWGANPKGWKDTQIAWHVRYPGLKKSLAFVASMTLPWYCFWKDEGSGHNPDPEEVNRYQIYNCKDASNTLHIWDIIQKSVASTVYPALIEEQHETAYAMYKMMLKGVAQDMSQRKIQLAKCLNLRMEVEAKLNQYTEVLTEGVQLTKGKTKTPWYSSPAQLNKILYDVFRLPVQLKRQTRQPTTDDKALKALMEIEPLFRPIFQLILEYRSLGVFISTFLQVKLDWDNRMRCSYGVGMAETFRCTSSTDAFDFGGNLQNIPSGNED